MGAAELCLCARPVERPCSPLWAQASCPSGAGQEAWACGQPRPCAQHHARCAGPCPGGQLLRPRGQFQVFHNSAHPTGCRQVLQHLSPASTPGSGQHVQREPTTQQPGPIQSRPLPFFGSTFAPASGAWLSSCAFGSALP